MSQNIISWSMYWQTAIVSLPCKKSMQKSSVSREFENVTCELWAIVMQHSSDALTYWGSQCLHVVVFSAERTKRRPFSVREPVSIRRPLPSLIPEYVQEPGQSHQGLPQDAQTSLWSWPLARQEAICEWWWWSLYSYSSTVLIRRWSLCTEVWAEFGRTYVPVQLPLKFKQMVSDHQDQ